MGNVPDRQGTTFESDIQRLKNAIIYNQKDIHHALMNILVEGVRRDAQKWTKIGLAIIGFLVFIIGRYVATYGW